MQLTDYYTFLLPEFINKCDFIDTLNGKGIDPNVYIKLNKKYKALHWARDPSCPHYNKYIPYYMNAPIIEAENNKLITIIYMIEDFYDDDETILVNDEYGFCELENIKIEKIIDWVKVESIDISGNRNDKINQILEIEEIEEEEKIEDLF